jgi:hypothetical protein
MRERRRRPCPPPGAADRAGAARPRGPHGRAPDRGRKAPGREEPREPREPRPRRHPQPRHEARPRSRPRRVRRAPRERHRPRAERHGQDPRREVVSVSEV